MRHRRLDRADELIARVVAVVDGKSDRHWVVVVHVGLGHKERRDKGRVVVVLDDLRARQRHPRVLPMDADAQERVGVRPHVELGQRHAVDAELVASDGVVSFHLVHTIS